MCGCWDVYTACRMSSTLAVQNVRQLRLRLLICVPAKVHNIIPSHVPNEADFRGRMSLTDAILLGDAAAVRALVVDSISASPSTRAARDATALHVPEEDFTAAVQRAAERGHDDVIRTLCELLPPPNPPLPFDIAAKDNGVYFAAVSAGHVALVRYLCDLPAAFGVAPGARDSEALFIAVERNSEDLVRLLCELPPERGVDPAEWDNQALRDAARFGHVGIVRLLCELPLERGVDPSAFQNEALCSAAGDGHAEVVQCLCQLPPERGVDPRMSGSRALEEAARGGHLDVVRALCEQVDPFSHGGWILRCAMHHKELNIFAVCHCLVA